ncbi:MAG: YgiQ family radical SAM protein [Clostridia bacterium]|nr:YgiQ family radical SAM protein [Clostridia bacterium]MBT7121451.1 YgiQ family radical SAM protein [Clostridia bacterium]
MNEFLPVSKADMKQRNIEQLDFIVVTPDAYVDHPSFAAAIIGRYAEALGYSVGIIAQPDWKTTEDFDRLGTPKFAFLLSAGNMDGIVNMYTAARKARREDAYSPGGKRGLRPSRPTIAYTARLKQMHKQTPVIIGGIEPSQRRFAHYDYLEDKVRRSYLVDSKADMLVYGMGENPLTTICERLAAGEHISELTQIRGTCIVRSELTGIGEHIELAPYEDVSYSKRDFSDAFRTIYKNAIPAGKTLVQKHGERYLIQYPQSFALTTSQMDAIYELPFTKQQHPMYEEAVPALFEVQFGIIAMRGCPGMCSFCSISAHQGKRIQKRSKKSIIAETKRIAAMDDFKGNISDVGGPTANFYDAICTSKNFSKCTRNCMSPDICDSLKVSHKGITEVLEGVEKVDGVKRVFIRSGLRHDYIMADKDRRFFDRLVKKHVSGQLKVAPEHVCQDVLMLMNKPSHKVYDQFAKRFDNASKRIGKKQYLLPYYISSHPGSTLDDAITLAQRMKQGRFVPEQVQDFYPTPGTLSTAMYYTGRNPLTGKPVEVATSGEDKAMQRALLQFNQKRNWPKIRAALKKAGRTDLIGRGGDSLVPPEQVRKKKNAAAEAPKKTSRRR